MNEPNNEDDQFSQDECSFVSLRDIERVMEVMVWFFEHGQELFQMMDEDEEDVIQVAAINEEDDEQLKEEEVSGIL